MKRTPLTRRTPLTSSSPMARAAALTRGVQMRRRARIRADRKPVTAAETAARRIVAERSHGLCEGCGRAKATDWSHRKAEGQGGPWCPSNGMHLCRGCHSWAHANPAAARSVGWHVLSGHNYQTTPALISRRGWVLLSPAGDITPTEKGAA